MAWIASMTEVKPPAAKKQRVPRLETTIVARSLPSWPDDDLTDLHRLLGEEFARRGADPDVEPHVRRAVEDAETIDLLNPLMYNSRRRLAAVGNYKIADADAEDHCHPLLHHLVAYNRRLNAQPVVELRVKRSRRQQHVEIDFEYKPLHEIFAGKVDEAKFMFVITGEEHTDRVVTAPEDVQRLREHVALVLVEELHHAVDEAGNGGVARHIGSVVRSHEQAHFDCNHKYYFATDALVPTLVAAIRAVGYDAKVVEIAPRRRGRAAPRKSRR